jgi:hypothetical protein
LTGNRNVPALGNAEDDTAGRRVTVPLSTPPGMYYVIACADDLDKLPESNYGNNCRASTTMMRVETPYLFLAWRSNRGPTPALG